MRVMKWISILGVIGAASLQAEILHSLDNQKIETNDSAKIMLYFPVGEFEDKSIELTVFSSDVSVIAPTDLTWGTQHSNHQLIIKSNATIGLSIISVVATTGAGLSDTTQFGVLVHEPIDTTSIFDGFISLDSNSGVKAFIVFDSDAGVMRQSGENPIAFAFESAFSQLSPDSKDTTYTTFSSNPDVIDPSGLIFLKTSDLHLMIFSGPKGGSSIVGLIGEDDNGTKDTVSYLVTVDAPPALEEQGSVTSLFDNANSNLQSIKINFQNQFLEIEDLDQSQSTTVTIHNLHGQTIYSSQRQTDQWNQDLSQLTQGQYYLQVNHKGNRMSQTLLIR